MDFLEWLKVILIGIVEGVTEWLPISSTGHMIIVNEFVKLNVTESFWRMFEVVIQLGAIMAVVVIYWKKIFPFGKGADHIPLVPKGLLQWVDKRIFWMWLKIIVACLPAAVIGIAFNDLFEAWFFNYVSVAIALIVFGVAFIVIERNHKGQEPQVHTVHDITFKLALIVGLFQLIAAIFPGTSRSGATIVGALMLGISRTAAAEFTFFMSIPVMFGASLLKLVKFGFDLTSTELGILIVGMVTAFVVSMLVIKLLMQYIKKHDFTVFGWYRIALGLLVIGYFSYF